MDFNFPTKQISELEEKLQIRKALQDITNRIHAAQNIKEILVDLKEGILQLFAAENMTIYVVDRNSNEIYSMFLAGTQLKEIRVPINNRSVAGYVAQNQKLVNVMDVYNLEEIKGIDKQLLFDSSWDKKSGFRTKQVLASPILRNNVLMGVIQILNKKKAGRFSDEETGFVQEIAEVLAVAFYNQERLAKRRKTRFDYLISRDLLKEEELDSAWEESRENKETMEDFLMNKYKISKSDIGHSLEEFYRCKYIAYNEKTPIPGDLLKNLKKEYLRRELWVPIGKVDGKIQVIVDDPNNILKRDMIESLLKTKAVKYDVSLAEDIIKYINLFYHSTADDSSINDILGKLEGTE
ncbi:MAG TPA: GAF domain-containing protein, partial [Smithella sp.]|nr:GAF domain-containing protein [Smithella sp.]